MGDLSLQEVQSCFALIPFEIRQDLALLTGKAGGGERNHVWLRVRRTDEREFVIRVNRRTGFIEPLPGGGEAGGEPPNWRWGHGLGTKEEYEERRQHSRSRPAFRCRGCSHLESAGHAGENAVPHSCSVCGAGVIFSDNPASTIAELLAKHGDDHEFKKLPCGLQSWKVLDPINWEILANATPARLNELGLAPDQVDRHAPMNAAEPNRQPKMIAVFASESLGMTEHLAFEQERPGNGVIAYSETERESLASGASLRDDGCIDMALAGVPPQGEQDNRNVARVLGKHLNAESFDGTTWESVDPTHELHDCEFADLNDPRRKRKLGVQVVRAIVRKELLQELAVEGSIDKRLTPLDATELLREAIQAKTTYASRTVVLALDATRLSGLAFDSVVCEFRSAHMDFAVSQGWKAIWLVGPTSRLTFRLDL